MTTFPNISPPPTDTTTTVEDGGATSFTAIHPDILETHILTRLDGSTLASASCASSQLYSLSCQDHLWSHVCRATWPSTSTPRVRNVISTFPHGARSFFAHSFPLLLSNATTPAAAAAASNHHRSPPPSELISAVDLHYRNQLIFSKIQETETVTDWFRCSPFRIDLLDPKDAISTSIQHPDVDRKCTALADELNLSWILIDPIGRRAVNLSSHKPVSVQRHWLTGEVYVLFSSIVAGDRRGSASDFVQCGVVVTFGRSEGGETQVREVSLEVENMDGTHLNGKESLVILQRALDCKGGKGWKREEEGKRRYREYEEMKRERRERKLRREGTLDMLCVTFGVSVFAAFWGFVLCR